MRLWAGSVFALVLAVPATAAAQGWVTRSALSYSGISKQVERLQWDRIHERARYRRILKKRGYADAQITRMTTTQLSAAALGPAAAEPPSRGEAPSKKRTRTAATKFKSVKKRLYLAELARSLAKDKLARKALLKIFETGIRSYEMQTKKEFKHDVAGAMAFLIGTSVLVYNQGEQPSDTGLEHVARALRTSLDTDPMRRISRKEKQKYYELMLGYGSYLLASYQAATKDGDAKFVGELRDAARVAVEGFLKLDPSKVRITEGGLELKGGDAGTSR